MKSGEEKGEKQGKKGARSLGYVDAALTLHQWARHKCVVGAATSGDK